MESIAAINHSLIVQEQAEYLSASQVLNLLGVRSEDINKIQSANYRADGRIFPNTNFGIYSSSRKIGKQAKQTSLEGLRYETVNYLRDFSKRINAQMKVSLIITGGTEAGHASGEYSHANGWKLDLRKTPEIKEFFVSNNWLEISRMHGGSFELGYKDPQTNAVWWDEGSHWDVSITA